MDQPEAVPLRLEWHQTPGVVTRYVSNMVIQHSQDEFYLSFFETVPPLVVGTPDEQRAQLAAMDTVRSECVARIVVTPARMSRFIEAMQDNFEHYQTRFGSQKEEQEC